MDAPSYSVVTPTWNEAANLRRLAQCMLDQTVRATEWVIVDTGSTDPTLAVANELALDHDWIRLISAPLVDRPQAGAPVVRAFHAGLEEVTEPVSVLVKLDADISFGVDYFERVLRSFAGDSRLGIASGNCYERDGDVWRETRVADGHVRGCARAYRWECLQQVLPLPEHMGWDGIDGLKAAVNGWRTELLRDVPFFHHRKVGERDGRRSQRWRAQGAGAHYMGYRFGYLALRSLHRARQDPAAVAMIWGYVAAVARRVPRYEDNVVREHLRKQQSLRHLPSRARHALSRRDTIDQTGSVFMIRR